MIKAIDAASKDCRGSRFESSPQSRLRAGPNLCCCDISVQLQRIDDSALTRVTSRIVYRFSRVSMSFFRRSRLPSGSLYEAGIDHRDGIVT